MKLSVCLITYNHECYISRALESVLAQRVDFPWEVVIGEDCSTDRTGAIVREYGAKYPELIRVLPTQVNLGLKGKNNFLRTLAACRGEYIALLEGDDFWTDPEKLAQQATLLDQHPECPFTFHPVSYIGEDGKRLSSSIDQRKDKFGPEDLLKLNFVPTCSSVFRSNLFRGFPDWVPEDISGDWLIYLLLARNGPFRRIPKLMGTYQHHSGGLWSSSPVVEQLRGIIRLLSLLDNHYGEQFRPIIAKRLARHRFELAWVRLVQGDRDGALNEYHALLADSDVWVNVPWVLRQALRLKLNFPRTFQSLDAVRRTFLWLPAPARPKTTL